MADGKTTLSDMLASVAVRCDGAVRRDDNGFSAADTSAGRALAFIPMELWGPEEAEAARALALKYRGQHGYGVEIIEEAYLDATKLATAGGEEFAKQARKLERIDVIQNSSVCTQVPAGTDTELLRLGAYSIMSEVYSDIQAGVSIKGKMENVSWMDVGDLEKLQDNAKAESEDSGVKL